MKARCAHEMEIIWRSRTRKCTNSASRNRGFFTIPKRGEEEWQVFITTLFRSNEAGLRLYGFFSRDPDPNLRP
ncbi:hypothetical protein KY285_000648 [Solanum tuberosum]|nr:hypothetical protein KY285_000648 [Solanum tuberosum]